MYLTVYVSGIQSCIYGLVDADGEIFGLQRLPTSRVRRLRVEAFRGPDPVEYIELGQNQNSQPAMFLLIAVIEDSTKAVDVYNFSQTSRVGARRATSSHESWTRGLKIDKARKPVRLHARHRR